MNSLTKLLDDPVAMDAVKVLMDRGYSAGDVEVVVYRMDSRTPSCTCDLRVPSTERCGDGVIRCKGALVVYGVGYEFGKSGDAP